MSEPKRHVDEVPSDFSFCESVHASGHGNWHLRRLAAKGYMFGGGIDTPFLCERKYINGWDVDVPLTPFHLENNTCWVCLVRFRKC